jgi:hypothetical protein
LNATPAKRNERNISYLA